MKQINKNYFLYFIAVGLIAFAIGSIFSVIAFPRVVEVPGPIDHKITEVIKEVPVEVEKIIEVDNGKLTDILNFIYKENGKINYLLEDLDEDEAEKITDRVEFIFNTKLLAVDYVNSEALDELHKEEINGLELDKRDIKRIKTLSAFEDIEVDYVDFENNDALLIVIMNFEQDKVKLQADFEVEFEDGLPVDIELLDLRER